MNHASVLDAGRKETRGGALSVPSKEFDREAFATALACGKLRCEKEDAINLGSLPFPSAVISSLMGSYSLLALLQGDAKTSPSSRLVDKKSRGPEGVRLCRNMLVRSMTAGVF